MTGIGLAPIIRNAAIANAERPGDYRQDGLLHCGSCKTPKQTVVELFGRLTTVSCACDCAREAYEAERRADREADRRSRIIRLRAAGIADRGMGQMTFAADDGSNPDLIGKAKRYLAAWDRMLADNIGLVLWGNTGNGKTFAAACIANALIDQGVPVLMTNFARLLGEVTGMVSGDRVRYMDSLQSYDLLVIDDFGVERQSEFSLEQVYSVIDGRYKTRKPLIMTTNITLDQLKRPENMSHQRIYDRVLEMCVPLHFSGESKRKILASEKLEKAKEVLA